MIWKTRALLGLGISVMFGAGSAFGQDVEIDANDIEEVVVTATRRATSLIDVPQSITALTSETMQARGIADVDALGRQSPGLVLNERDDKTPNVVMRGVGSFGNVLGVGFYIDDVQNFTDQTMRLQDLERIEVLKGPQGTLFGGSSIGGAIRYITKRPEAEPSAEVAAEVGEFGYRNIYGAATGPLAGTTLAGRVSAYYSEDDGFLKNGLVPDFSRREEYGVRGQLLFEPTPNLSAMLTLRYRNFDGGAQLGTRQNSVSKVDYRGYQDAKPTAKSETYGVVADVSYDFSGVTLDWVSSYTRQDKDFVGDADYTSAPRVLVFTDNPHPAEITTHEVRLTSNDSGKLDWIVGLYADELKNAQVTPTPVTAVLFGGVVTIPEFFNYKTRQRDFAAFGSVDFHFGSLTTTFGARYHHVEYDADIIAQTGAPTGGLRINNDDDAVLPRFVVSYETPEGRNIYATLARGYEPGKVSVTTDNPAPFGPESTWALEIGSKGYVFGRSLYYEIAGFYTKYKDRQFENRIFDPSGAPVEVVENIGDSTSYGGEFSLNWLATENLTLNGSVGYLHAEWDDGTTYVSEDEFGNGVVQDLSGRTPPNSPKWTANVGATYRQPISSGLVVTFHADASYTDKLYWKPDYLPVSNLNPSHWLAFAQVALSDVDGRWRIAASLSNIFDEEYYTNFTPEFFGLEENADGTCNLCHWGNPGARRRLTISASTRF